MSCYHFSPRLEGSCNTPRTLGIIRCIFKYPDNPEEGAAYHTCWAYPASFLFLFCHGFVVVLFIDKALRGNKKKQGQALFLSVGSYRRLAGQMNAHVTGLPIAVRGAILALDDSSFSQSVGVDLDSVELLRAESTEAGEMQRPFGLDPAGAVDVADVAAVVHDDPRVSELTYLVGGDAQFPDLEALHSCRAFDFGHAACDGKKAKGQEARCLRKFAHSMQIRCIDNN